MKKIDKLVLKAFFGPFIITLAVADFLLLVVTLLKYIDDFVGKGLGFAVFAELFTYFAANVTPNALPLAILLSSLMTFGNLGEHLELTAIKSAGISLVRVLRSIFFIAVLLTIFAYFFNDQVVPRANLKAFSLLYDIRQKKPALNLKEGIFYNGIPGYSIKISKKLADGTTLKDIIIYDHNNQIGNKNVIAADSGKMYTIYNDSYLVMEMFDGYSFREGEMEKGKRSASMAEPLLRSSFKKSKLIFDLSSFNLARTKEELFKNNRLMKNVAELTHHLDSLDMEREKIRYKIYMRANKQFQYHLHNKIKIPQELEAKVKEADTAFYAKVNKEAASYEESDTLTIAYNKLKKINPSDLVKIDKFLHTKHNKSLVLQKAVAQARQVKQKLVDEATKVNNLYHESDENEVEVHKKFSLSVSCIIMFLIGAPLGSIIKRGGIGFPVIISALFFIASYVFYMIGEKNARQDVIEPFVGIWAANVILLPFGLFFLRQARRDARLLDTDFYNTMFQKIKNRLTSIRKR